MSRNGLFVLVRKNKGSVQINKLSSEQQQIVTDIFPVSYGYFLALFLGIVMFYLHFEDFMMVCIIH